MGFLNIPLAIGWTLTDLAAGYLYDRDADRANLALRYLSEHEGFSKTEIASIARTDALTRLETTLHVDARAATELLWTTYHPSQFWIPFAAVGFLSAIAMFFYSRAARNWATAGQ